ncbi:MAG: di-trans,poly-cis-decaprenylcistransferase [Rhabdochlamydiaceae bacterium]|nr:di-trans,poly-cis-decaprenylcistransferase [Rhabdochlamydiaceae bacterium]
MANVRLGLIPEHVAIIMDGNRRWAKLRGFPPVYGHWKGAEVLTEILRFASKLGVKVLTVYAFSTENWSRSPKEIDQLMRLISFYLRKKRKSMIEESVRLETIGDLSRLPDFVREKLRQVKEDTASGSKIRLVLALNYGSRDEIKRAVEKIADDLKSEKIVRNQISEELISSYLDTASLGDPSLFIRTSGEQRLSNFLLWQLSYTEVYLTKVLWPDFKPIDLLDAIFEFQRRERRLGGT